MPSNREAIELLEEDEQFDKYYEMAKKTSIEIGKQSVYYAKIDDSLKSLIKGLVKVQASEGNIQTILEKRLRTQYEYASETEKFEMRVAGLEAERSKIEADQQAHSLEMNKQLLALAQAKTDEERETANVAIQAIQNKLDADEVALKRAQEQEDFLTKYKGTSYKQYLKDKENQDKVENKQRIAREKALAAQIAKEKAEAEGATEEDKAAAVVAQVDARKSAREAESANTLKELKDNIGKALSDGIKQLGKTLDNAVEKGVQVVSTYRAKIDYRLEGIDKTFDSVYKMTQKNLGTSTLVKQQAVLERIGKAIDQGIAYNVEQRAFLAEVSEKIQGTFDAFDSNLLRLVRIQSADSTAARLGMQKALNDMLTTYYQDSSYLNDAFKSVSAALFEMTGTSDYKEAVAQEYAVQKWMGGLYSVGVSQNAIQQIATGIGYLGSGNVQALSGNTGLQNLLALSASKAGLDYAELLTSGLSVADTNRLLKSMVDYLAEIAESTAQNKVVTSAYGNIFGLSLSDIRGFQNLQATASNLYSDNLSYDLGVGIAETSLSKLPQYMGTAEKIQNAMDNVTFNVGMLYSNGLLYGLYKAVDLLGDLTGGGPTFKVSPWGIGLSFNVVDILKGTMFGAGLIGNLLTSGGNIYGGSTLAGWGAQDYRSYGTGAGLRTTNATSYSATIGNQSSSDVSESALSEGMEQSEEVQSATGAKEKDMYDALVKKGDKELVSNIKIRMESVDNQITKAYQLLEEVSNYTTKKSLNVNIQKVNGKDLIGESLPTLPSQEWEKLVLAAAVLIKYGTTINGFGGGIVQTLNAGKDQDGDKPTLEDFLEKVMPLLDTTGIPVRVESLDTMSNLFADLSRR